MICLRLLVHWIRRAASRADWTAGKSRPIRTAMIAMTTSSSIRVKPRFSVGLHVRCPHGLVLVKTVTGFTLCGGLSRSRLGPRWARPCFLRSSAWNARSLPSFAATLGSTHARALPGFGRSHRAVTARAAVRAQTRHRPPSSSELRAESCIMTVLPPDLNGKGLRSTQQRSSTRSVDPWWLRVCETGST